MASIVMMRREMNGCNVRRVDDGHIGTKTFKLHFVARQKCGHQPPTTNNQQPTANIEGPIVKVHRLAPDSGDPVGVWDSVRVSPYTLLECRESEMRELSGDGEVELR